MPGEREMNFNNPNHIPFEHSSVSRLANMPHSKALMHWNETSQHVSFQGSHALERD